LQLLNLSADRRLQCVNRPLLFDDLSLLDPDRSQRPLRIVSLARVRKARVDE
jgi:hypothetical protein